MKKRPSFRSELTGDPRPGVLLYAFASMCQLDDVEITPNGAAAMMNIEEQDFPELRSSIGDFPVPNNRGYYSLGEVSAFIETNLNNQHA